MYGADCLNRDLELTIFLIHGYDEGDEVTIQQDIYSIERNESNKVIREAKICSKVDGRIVFLCERMVSNENYKRVSVCA